MTMKPDDKARARPNRGPWLFDAIQRIPAGMMLVPTVIGALIHTFCPQVLQIGNPTQALLTSDGMQVCVGAMLFFTGTQLALRELGPALRRVMPLLGFKLVVAYALAGAFYLLFGLGGVGGVSFLAFTVAMTSTNAALFLATVRPYGGVDEYALFGMFMLTSMPALPLLMLSGASGGGVDWTGLLSCVVPLLLGMLIGNADKRFQAMFSGGTTCLLPLFGFQFGSLVNIGSLAGQTLQGLGLTAAFYVLSVVPLYLFEHLVLKKPGHVGVATCSVAGIAVSFPMMAAASAQVYAPFVDAAVSQLALIMFVTTFLTPFLSQLVVRHAHVPRTDVLAEAREAQAKGHELV